MNVILFNSVVVNHPLLIIAFLISDSFDLKVLSTYELVNNNSLLFILLRIAVAVSSAFIILFSFLLLESPEPQLITEVVVLAVSVIAVNKLNIFFHILSFIHL